MTTASDSTTPGASAGSPGGTAQSGSSNTRGGLRRDAIDWKQVAILSIAGCGPASVIALNLQFMGAFAGSALVLAFVIVWPGILLLVNTFAEFSKRLPTSGGLYTWNSRAWGKNVGFVYGWTFIGAYMVFSAAGFAVFGGWVEQWLDTQFDVNVPWWLFTAAALIYVTTWPTSGSASRCTPRSPCLRSRSWCFSRWRSTSSSPAPLTAAPWASSPSPRALPARWDGPASDWR